jgi:hypothetical protein
MWDFQQRGLIPTTFKSFEDMKAAVTVTKPLSDLQEVLDRFTFHELCFATIPMVEEVTREAILDAALVENINKLEFRFSPAYMAKTKVRLHFSLVRNEICSHDQEIIYSSLIGMR